ncbi:hypothetical protein N7468_005648 [Penicillium chermesinum]|uniref:Tyrosyl-DNA phosphodiesterase n=1 Tax=Penicillium chermesinum TaxID=63820 RepID=A0A9W9P220_9EURO|nr:uncharacterized protein N7468_005648 [Penicillium chermesinum]KAJ5232692.1 hypothetical protein N7468_005648 [Penicillium chermesinum]
MERPAKRTKVSDGSRKLDGIAHNGQSSIASLHRSISPPPRSNSRQSQAPISGNSKQPGETQAHGNSLDQEPSRPRLLPSPFKLTHIRDLHDGKGLNTDTVKLSDVLGDPMIRECWQFNYLFDVDFLMSQFDEDVRQLVKVKVIHGSWRREDSNRIRVEETCARWPNVEPIVAFMPEAFGTHHSKMMILIRHDDSAEVVIHTANMIRQDWTNMTQAVWRSPVLPLRDPNSPAPVDSGLGTGVRFKRDLLAYLKTYGVKKTGPLVKELLRYDFGAIRAALVASVPSKQKINDLNSDRATLWGWPALKDLMGRIPISHSPQNDEKSRSEEAHIVVQISSVATLVIDLLDEKPKRDAGRGRAAPHIKTYIRFADSDKLDTIDWAMVTSANLSIQAWGAGTNQSGEVRICSYEIGVVVWPGLLAEEPPTSSGADMSDSRNSIMVPCFLKDEPDAKGHCCSGVTTVVGFRMPYKLPLTPYGRSDEPWCATAMHSIPDWQGRTWTV